MTNLSKNQIALAGEFAVLSQLALHGFDANLTLGNTKGVDILLTNSATGKMRRLEVKTHSHNKPFKNKRLGTIAGKWRMGKKHEEMADPDLFFYFVTIEHITDNFDFYIVPSKVVSEYVKWSHIHWLAEDTRHNDSDMRSFDLIMGTPNNDYPVPKAQDYHRNWKLLE